MKKLFASIVRSKFLLAALLACAAGSAAALDVTLIPGGSNNRVANPAGSTNWHYRLGTSEPSALLPAWRTNIFVEDGTWSVGALPIGYTTGANDPNNFEGNLVTTLPTSAPTAGNYTAVFLRKTFVVTNRTDYTSLTLEIGRAHV